MSTSAGHLIESVAGVSLAEAAGEAAMSPRSFARSAS